ncbi:hypothetical protein [Pseudonocardia sp. D17]|uniref:hypothetical protein n=1 Tax=Pseudonocardia sp. D17 TaxID=882661 RepID=UPI0030CBEE9E|nr:hypothetical protein PSD17_41080 [Pseudonocardia sp. D17]
MSESNVADRLLSEARKRTAQQERTAAGRGKLVLVVGIIAFVASPISLAGYVLGVITIGLGIATIRKPEHTKNAKIALALGVAAILVATFFFTLRISMH